MRINHPDSHELDDWPLYGPRDPEIARLVVQLAEQHQMRLADIEAIILVTLRGELARQSGKAGDIRSDVRPHPSYR